MTAQDQAPKPQTNASKAILITTAVVGGLALFAAGTSAAFGGGPARLDMWSNNSGGGPFWGDDADSTLEMEDDGSGVGPDGDQDTSTTALVDDVSAIDVDVAAAALTIEFGDVDEATLEGPSRVLDIWSLTTEEGELVLESTEASRTAGCLFECGDAGFGERRVTLTLPRFLSEDGQLDADLSVTTGSLHVQGDFRELDVDIEAGELQVDGSAERFGLDVSTGSATVDLANVTAADIGLDTGEARVTLTGAAPDSVEASADLGSLTIDLPKEKYRVDVEKGLGGLRNELAVSKDSKHLVRAELGAGELILR